MIYLELKENKTYTIDELFYNNPVIFTETESLNDIITYEAEMPDYIYDYFNSEKVK